MKSMSQKRNNGFVLLFAVLVAGVILSAALGISRIVNKEIVLASIGKDSQLAFFAADSGAECALFWNNRNAFSRQTPFSGPVFCGGLELLNNQANPVVAGNQQVIKAEMSQSEDLTVNILGGQEISVFGLASLNASGDVDLALPCSVIIVNKENPVLTKIISRGYNTCVETRRRVERALEITIAG